MESNYYEYVLFTSQPSENAWVTNIPLSQVQQIMKALANRNYKYFQREFKELCYGDIVYQNFHNEELKVYRITPLKTDIKKNHVLACSFNKQKLSLVNVPSNANPDHTSYVKQLIYRISNRIYLNIAAKKQCDNIVYNVFINYNHDLSVDPKQVDQQLDKLFNILVEPIS